MEHLLQSRPRLWATKAANGAELQGWEMPKRVPLPSALQGRAFLFRDARQMPLGAGRLRGMDLERPFRGVRVANGAGTTEIDVLLERCATYAPLLVPGRFFSHLTATRLWGAPLPRDFDPGESLHVSTVAPGIAPRMVGIVGHQSSHSLSELGSRHGFATSGPESTWLSLGDLLPLDELVVIGDYLVLDPVVLNPIDVRPFTTIERLAASLASFHGRGARSLARALPLIRSGAESRPETLLRLLIVRGGLPEPEANIAVTDTQGRELGRGDLVYSRWRTVVEYDGDGHRTNTRQYERDIHRLESFRDARWHVVQVRSRGLFVTPQQTIARITAALRQGGWPG